MNLFICCTVNCEIISFDIEKNITTNDNMFLFYAKSLSIKPIVLVFSRLSLKHFNQQNNVA